MYENDDDNTPIPHVSLFSGYGGIDLALRNIFGRRLRTIGYCERDFFPCANLVDKIEKGRLDAAPIFTDVRTFPWESYAPFMANGILSFGFPCQPVSCAGKRKVAEDERWMFDIVAEGIAILKPGIAFAENVDGLLSAKMPDGKPVIARIYERLESLGYRIEVGLFSAAEVGAPHQRKRVFILAALDDPKSRESVIGPKLLGQAKGEDDCFGCPSPLCGGLELANRNSINWRTPTEERQHDGQTGPASIELAHNESNDRGDDSLESPGRKGSEWGRVRKGLGCLPLRIISGFSGVSWPARPGQPQYEWEEPRVVAYAPHQLRDGSGKTRATRRRESANESLWQIEPGFLRAAYGPGSRLDPNRNRIDRLRLIGNGVVPQTAEKAFRTLYGRIQNEDRPDRMQNPKIK